MTPHDIREMLAHRKMTQAGFATLIGVAPRTLRDWLSGRTAIPLWAQKIIAIIRDSDKAFNLWRAIQ